MKTNTAINPLLSTKLYRPRVPPRHVHRSVLVQRLENNYDKSFILVSAPAGYGKSTLVSCWLSKTKRPGAWLSIDEKDNDMHQFVSYFVAAVQSVFPNELSQAKSLVESSNWASPSILAGILVNELERIEQELILVLDDIHLIREKTVLDFLSTLLSYPSKCTQLVLIGRTDPILPIALLRAKRLMFELRMRDLRFTEAESAEFLQIAAPKHLDESTIAAFVNKVEGWVTGLHLAALVIHEHSGSRQFLELKGTTRYVAEYLVDEVLDKQPSDILSCLLRSSILDRFCGALCDAMFDEKETSRKREACSTFPSFLQNSDLFIIPLDSENRWFRFHHLFQSLLRRRMEGRWSPEEIAIFHLRAAAWFIEHEMIEEALSHFQKGGDGEAAGQVVAHYGHELIDKERTVDLGRWLRQLPRDVIDQNPMLLIFEAWIERVKIRIPRMSQALRRAESLLRTDPPEKPIADAMWGYWNAITCFERYLVLDHEEAKACADRAVMMVPQQTPYLRGFAMIIQAATMQMTGDFKAAVAVMSAALADPILRTHNHGILLAGLSPICLLEANSFALYNAATRLSQLAKLTRLPIHRGWGRLYLAVSHYQFNETEAALGDLESFMEDRFIIYPHAVLDGGVILSLCHQHAGRLQEARDTADLLGIHAREIGHADVLLGAEAFQAELALRQGRLTEAVAWARAFTPRQLHAFYFFYLAELTLAKVLMAEDTLDSLQSAQDLLSDLEMFSRATQNRSVLIPVLALQADLLDRQDDHSGADDKLAEAVSLAATGGNIRQFLDLGPVMTRRLERLRIKDTARVFIEKILAAFGNEDIASHSLFDSRPPHHATTTSLLITPLTPRELDVLDLLALRLQNKEIANKLFVSPTTVKSHLKHIYQKLCVENRLGAVQKAKKLGIL